MYLSLEAEKKDLLARKLRLTKDNAEKKAALDVLDKQLEDFIAVCRNSTTQFFVDTYLLCHSLQRKFSRKCPSTIHRKRTRTRR